MFLQGSNPWPSANTLVTSAIAVRQPRRPSRRVSSSPTPTVGDSDRTRCVTLARTGCMCRWGAYPEAMDDDECLTTAAEPTRVELRRETRVGGRVYEVTVSVSEDARADLSVVACDEDRQVYSDLRGVLSPDDLGVLARVLGAELASLAAWYGVPVDARSYTLAEKRREHHNAYAPWTPGEEQRLLRRHGEGATVDELSAEFGRNAGGIRARLEKLVAVAATDPDAGPPFDDPGDRDGADHST